MDFSVVEVLTPVQHIGFHIYQTHPPHSSHAELHELARDVAWSGRACSEITR